MNTTNSLQQLYHRYWAKATNNKNVLSYHLLPYHLLDVAAVGYILLERDTRLRKRLADLCGMPEEALHLWLVFMLALHDVGKFSQTFQYLMPNLSISQHLRELPQRATDYAVRHDSLGHILWKHLLGETIQHLDIENIERQALDRKLLFRWLHAWEPAIMGHHGKPPEEKNAIKDSDLHYYFLSTTQEAAKEFARDTAQILGLWNHQSPMRFPQNPNEFSCSSWNIAGFAVLCDWIGSSNHFMYNAEPMPLADYWNSIALPSAKRAMQAFGVVPSNVETICFSCKTLFGFDTPSPLQAWSETFSPDASPQLLIVEDVTGAGKTEAALLLANRLIASGNADGLFFALPTMATANAMHRRLEQHYRKLFAPQSRPSLVLAHGAATLSKEFRMALFQGESVLNDDYAPNDESVTSECNPWLADTRKKAFLADVGVGTIDQALLAVLQSKHQSLRLFGMTRKVLIVDEVHANDAYMHKILQRVLEFQAALGGSAILLSATLPLSMRQDLVRSFAEGLTYRKKDATTHKLHPSPSYPWITHLSASGLQETPCASRPDVERNVIVEMCHTSDEVLMAIHQAVSAGKCVCWVRNTVRDAWEAYQTLQGYGIEHIMLFHARFAMCDRLCQEQEVLRHFGKDSTSELRRGRVVIATQVVEQSLDVDFDILITDLAPIELLIQRFGRAMRHVRNAIGNRFPAGAKDERGEPHVIVFAPSIEEEITPTWYSALFAGGAKVYPDHAVLWRTAKLLAEHKAFRMPDDARPFVEAAYQSDTSDVPEALLRSHIKAQSAGMAARGVAAFNTLNCKGGYTETEGNWLNDAVTPTRLGSESTTIRLARYCDGHILPWADAPEYAWELSQVNILSFYITSATFRDETALARAKESMPDKGKYAVTLVLEKHSEHSWRGRAINQSGQEITVEYNPSSGLAIIPNPV